jgi:hypothetical protein
VADGEKSKTLRVEADPDTASVVARIFREYLGGHGLLAIAEGLTADQIPSPSAHDRRHNPHHRGIAWSKGSVRTILVNERYTVGGGADQEGGPVLQPLVDRADFERVAQTLVNKRCGRSEVAVAAKRVYVVRGILRCGLCNRIMECTWNNKEPYYRCRFPPEYASANLIRHPRNIYLRESRLLDPLGSWLSSVGVADSVSDYPHLAGKTLAVRHGVDSFARLRSRTSGPDSTDTDYTELFNRLGLRLRYFPSESVVRATLAIRRGATPIRGELRLG